MRAGDPGTWMWAEACALIDRAERLQRQFFQPGLSAAPASWEPPIDILETERELSIIAALPGVEPHDLEQSDDREIAHMRDEARTLGRQRVAAEPEDVECGQQLA